MTRTHFEAGYFLALMVTVLASPGVMAAKAVPSFPVGPMVAYPIATVSFGYGNDMLSGDNQNKEGSWYITGSAGAGIQGERRGHLYGVEYEASLGQFNNSSIDNFVDHRVTAYGGHAFNIRNNVKLGAEYLDAHDARGEEDPRSGAGENLTGYNPDLWHQLQIGGKYIYGAPNAKGRVECDACQTNRRYDNNGQEYRDVDVSDLGITLAVRVSPKTNLLFGGQYSKFDYVNERPGDVAAGKGRDSEEMRYFVGADWDITPKTSVAAKAGLLEKNYEDTNSTRSDSSEPYWDINGSWSPRGRTNVNLGYSRQTYEYVPYEDAGNQVVDYDHVVGQTLRLSWGEQWASQWSSNLSAYAGRDEFVPTSREDDIWGASANIRYLVNDWVSVGLTGYYRKRDSNEPLHDYEDSGIGLTLNLGVGGSLGWGARAPSICSLRSGRGSVWTE